MNWTTISWPFIRLMMSVTKSILCLKALFQERIRRVRKMRRMKRIWGKAPLKCAKSTMKALKLLLRSIMTCPPLNPVILRLFRRRKEPEKPLRLSKRLFRRRKKPRKPRRRKKAKKKQPLLLLLVFLLVFLLTFLLLT